MVWTSRMSREVEDLEREARERQGVTYRRRPEGASLADVEAECPRCERWSIILNESGFCPWPMCGYETREYKASRKVAE